MVIKYCKEGWPTNVPSSLRPYQKVKSEISLTSGLVTFQDRIVVLSIQRKEVLHKLHESHQVFKKYFEFAKLTVFWPGIRDDLRRLVENCQTCQENRPAQRQEPLRPTELPQRPWSKLGADFCKYKGKHYFVVTDYYSR